MTDVQTDTGVLTDGSLIKSSALNTADKLFLTNQEASSAVTGDVLALDTSNDLSYVFGSDSYPYSPAFVVPSDIDTDGDAQSKTIAASEQAWVYKPGAYVPLATVDGAVDIGEYLEFSSTSKKFAGTGIIADTSGMPPSTAKAIALEAAAGAGQIAVMLLPLRPWTCHTCRVYNSADENMTASTIKEVTFDSTRHDPMAMHDDAGEDSQIIIPATLVGTAPFLISLMGKLFVGGGVANAYVAIRVDGTTIVAKQCANANLMTVVETVVNLTAAQYVEFIAYTTSSSAVVDYFPNVSPELAVSQIGGAYLG